MVLGAGFDTFAYRNPFAGLRVFEVDFPATQEWKRSLLVDAAVAVPENLTFVPLDFEHKALADGLRECGVDLCRAGVSSAGSGGRPLLTLEAFRATLVVTVAQLHSGSGLTFDYAFPPESRCCKRRAIFYRLGGRLAAAGEPFQLFFTPEQVIDELRCAGFHRIEQADHDRLNTLYFQNRADGLKLSPVGIGMLATAWT